MIVATYVDTVHGIRLEADQLPARFAIVRHDPDGRYRTVRAATDASSVGGSWLGYDYEAPLGSAVTYAAAAVGSVVPTGPASAPVSTPAGVAWLRHVANPALSREVIVIELGAIARAARSQTYNVHGRPRPVVVSDVRSARTGSSSILCPDNASRDALEYLCDSGSALLLQLDPRAGFADCYLTVDNLTTERRGPRDLRVAGHVATLEWTEVDSPPGTVLALTENTWANVVETDPTWADALVHYSSWSAMYAGHDSQVAP